MKKAYIYTFIGVMALIAYKACADVASAQVVQHAAQAVAAPGAVPSSVTTELLKVLGIISGYNVLLSAVQKLLSKAAAPTSSQLSAIAGAAVAGAAQAATAQAAPTVTAVQATANAALQLAKVLGSNPSV